MARSARRIQAVSQGLVRGSEEALIVSRSEVRTRFRRRDESDWSIRVEQTDSENVVEVNRPPARRATRSRGKQSEKTAPKAQEEGKSTSSLGQRVAYVRVSAADQNEARHIEAVGECDRAFVEKGSGRSREGRSQLAACIAYLREGDTLVVASMDRLARSLVDLKQIVGEVISKGGECGIRP